MRVQCPFCGNTAEVPLGLRDQADQPSTAAQHGAAPQPGASPKSVAYHDKHGRPAVLNYADFKVIADAVRAGDQSQAVALFQSMFQTSQAEAQQAIATMAVGGEVSVGTTALGGQMYLGVSRIAPPAPITFSGGQPLSGQVSSLNTGMSSGPLTLSSPLDTRSGLFRLNMIAAGCGVFVAVLLGCCLPIGMLFFMNPNIASSLSQLWGQLTGR